MCLLRALSYWSRWMSLTLGKATSMTEFDTRAASKLGADAINRNSGQRQFRIST